MGESNSDTQSQDNSESSEPSHTLAAEFVTEFSALRNRAKDSLVFSLNQQRYNYNKAHSQQEFEVGDKVLINQQSLRLLEAEKGRGQKLQMRYDGPFEIIRKLSPITYHLRFPASYRLHPIINSAHLSKYHESSTDWEPRAHREMHRSGFDAHPECEVDKIIAE